MSFYRWIFVIAGTMVFFLYSISPAAADQKKNVLLLHSYHQGYKWTDDETQGVLAGLAPVKSDLTLHIEYMDTKMAFDEHYFDQLRNLYKYYKYKFRKIRFDLIIAMDDDAFNFLKRYRDGVFPNTAIVFCGTNWFNPQSVPAGFKGYTGVNEDADISATLDLMLKLHPTTKNIYVINDTTTTGKKIHAQFDGVVPNYKDKASFTFLENMDLSAILDTINKLGKESLVFLTIFQKDKAGQFFEFSESASMISRSSRVPVYGLWDFNLGFGIVGGMLTSGYYQGKTAGEMAVNILRGVQADAIPVLMKSPNRYMFDYAQLQRWNIHRSDLPADSVVINEPVTFYERYKGLVWGVGSGFLGLAIIIVLLVVNIQQRRKAEETLRESEKRLTEIIDFLPDATFAIDKDGKIIAWNRAVEEMTGIKAEHMLGKGDFEYALPFYGQRRPVLIDLLFKRDEEIEKKYYSLTKKGEYLQGEEASAPVKGEVRALWGIARLLFDSKGNTVGAIESIRDITERKQAEEVLRESETRLSEIINFLPDATFAIDLDGKIIVWNRAAEDYTGVKAPDMMGKGDQEYSIPFYGMKRLLLIDLVEKPAEEIEKLFSYVKKEGVKVSGEGYIQSVKHGEAFMFGIAAPLYNFEGSVVGAIESIRDVTERKKLEQQLRQSQKMEAIGNLAGGIAHDFNNILTAIIGYGTLLRMRLDEGSPLRDYADDILGASERAAHLTKSLLAFSRKQELHLQPVELNEIVKRFGRFILRVIGADIECKTTLNEEDLIILADSGQIEQVIMNLATNARDAMPAGGILTIKTERVDIGGGISGSGIPPGSYAVLSLSDTGKGMDEETRLRIFEPFFTTKEQDKGTGLGLSIVYGIVKQHGGEISVYSEPGTGTTFRIYFRLIDSKGDRVLPAATASSKGGSETILLAEDDSEVRRLMKILLEEYGYTVITAIDGEDAVKKFLENKDKIQCLFFDVVMPKKNGKEAYEEIRRMKEDVPVLFASGYTAELIQKRGLLEEGWNFISKPVTPNLLLAKIRQILDT